MLKSHGRFGRVMIKSNLQFWISIALGAAAFALLGTYGIHFGSGSASNLEQRLEQAAADALLEREHVWASVRVEGQIATVTGRAPNESARLDAMSAVLGAQWAGGRVAGGIVEAIDLTSSDPLAHELNLFAMAAGGRVLIQGDVASEADRGVMRNIAERLFSAEVGDELIIAPDAATSTTDIETMRRALVELARLENGALVLAQDRAGLYGTARSSQTARSVLAGFQALSQSGQGSVFLTMQNGDSFVAGLDGPESCALIVQASQLDELAETNTASRRARLTSVGQIVSHCPETRLTAYIGGADQTATTAAEERAEQIRAALLSSDLDSDRLTIIVDTDQTTPLVFQTAAMEAE